MLSKLKRIILWIFGSMVLVVLLVWAGVMIFFPDDRVLSLLLDEVRTRTGWQVTARSLDLDLFRGFVLDDVALGPAGDFRGPALEIERVELGYDPGALFHRQIMIKSATLNGVRGYMRWSGNRWNIETMLVQLNDKMADAKKNEMVDHEQGDGWYVDISDINVTDLSINASGKKGVNINVTGATLKTGNIVFIDGKLKLRARLSLPVAKDTSVELGDDTVGMALGADLDLNFDSTLGLEVEGDIIARDFRLQALSSGVDLGVFIRAKVTTGGSSFQVSDLVISSGQEQIVHAHGSISFGHGAYKLKASSDLVELIPPIRKLLGLTHLHGDIRLVDSTFEMPLDASRVFQARTTLVGDGISFSSKTIELEGTGIHARVSARRTADGRSKVSLNGTMEAENFTAGPVRGSDLRGKMQFVAALDDSDRWGLSTQGATLDVFSGAIKYDADDAANAYFRGDLSARCLLGGKHGVVGVDCTMVEVDGTYGWAKLFMKDASLWGAKGQFGLKLGDMHMGRTMLGVRHVVAATGFRIGAVRTTTVDTGASRIRVELDGRHLQGNRFRFPASVVVSGDFADVSLVADQDVPVFLGRLRANIRTWLRSRQERSFPFSVNIQSSLAKIVRLRSSEPWFVTGPVSVDAEGLLAIASATVSLNKTVIGIKDLLDVSLSGSVDLKNALLDCKFETGKHDLKNIRALLPGDIRSHVPHVWGKVRLVGSVSGKFAVPDDYRHLPFSIDLSVMHENLGFRVDAAGLEASHIYGSIQIKAGPGYGNQIQSTIKMHSDKIRFGSSRVSASGVDVNLAGTLDADTLSNDGSMRFDRLYLPGVWSSPLSDVGVSFSSSIVGFKDVRLNEVKLMAPTLGVTMSGHGKLLLKEGVKNWSDLRISLATRTTFDSGRFVRFPGGVDIKGRAEVDLDLDTLPSGGISASGGIKMSGLDLSSAWVSVKDAEGMLPVFQRIEATSFRLMGGTGASQAKSTRSSAYHMALLPLKGTRRCFSVGLLKLGKLEFAGLSGDLAWDSGRVDLSDLRFSFLSGDVISQTSITLAPEQNRGLWLDAQMSDIDLSKLGTFGGLGSSEVTGNLRLSLDWRHRDLSSSFHLTSIGRSTLLAMLSALEHDNADSGLVEFRKFLQKYDVIPRDAQLDIRHGLVSMIVHLDMGTLARVAAGFIHGYRRGAFYLPPVPVGNILSKYLQF